MDRPRLLFVDDEPNIRLTLPEILKMHGFDVTAAATVPEALAAIHAKTFDVLIADLNIGQPGDGFTVVSAMRRTQPKAVTIIMTGFPAFETALQAIRSQVDDYVVKPASVDQLLSTIDDKLKNHTPAHQAPFKRVGTVLRENKQAIFDKWLRVCKANRELGSVRISDEERTDHLPQVFEELTDTLDRESSSEISKRAHKAAAIHGRKRYEQGFTLPMVHLERSLMRHIIYDMVQQNLLAVDISNLLGDLIQASDAIDVQVKRAVEAYLEDERAPNPRAA